MAQYTPTSEMDTEAFNPNMDVPHKKINSGYPLSTDFLKDYQNRIQEAIRQGFLDTIKYPGLANVDLPLYLSTLYKNFDLLAHRAIAGGKEQFIINAGTAYDALGNRLHLPNRLSVILEMSADQQINGHAFLCVRKLGNYQPMNFMVHPVNGIPQATQIVTDVEFYLSDGYVEALTDPIAVYYPPLESGLIPGAVLAKVYYGATPAPETWVKTVSLKCKDGDPTDVTGYIEIYPSTLN